MPTFTIPIIDSENGAEYDIEVEAEDTQAALEGVPDNVYVSFTFIDEHFGVDAPDGFDTEQPEVVE